MINVDNGECLKRKLVRPTFQVFSRLVNKKRLKRE